MYRIRELMWYHPFYQERAYTSWGHSSFTSNNSAFSNSNHLVGCRSLFQDLPGKQALKDVWNPYAKYANCNSPSKRIKWIVKRMVFSVMGFEHRTLSCCGNEALNHCTNAPSPILSVLLFLLFSSSTILLTSAWNQFISVSFSSFQSFLFLNILKSICELFFRVFENKGFKTTEVSYWNDIPCCLMRST